MTRVCLCGFKVETDTEKWPECPECGRDNVPQNWRKPGDHAVCGAVAGAMYGGPPGALVGYILGSFFGKSR